MHVIYVTSETVPFAKTGGLADVLGALPRYLEPFGHQLAVFLPFYKQVKEGRTDIRPTGLNLEIPVGDRLVRGDIRESSLPNSRVKVYLIRNEEYYERDNLYGTAYGDYPDNAERFVFFCRAVLETLKKIGRPVDVIHCHDWQAALIPVYLKNLYRTDPLLKEVKTVLTIHNLAYQGIFSREALRLTGLDDGLFYWEQLEFWGKLNLLKGGLVFADLLTTASPTYAREIQTAEFGCGLEGVLRQRSGALSGILNGADYTDWNPATDKLIPAPYDAAKINGKAACKAALQKSQNLLMKPEIPLLGMVTRLADQKGLDIFLEVFDELMKEYVQFVLLGTGEERYHQKFKEINQRYPTKTAVNITFDNKLAHLITAGADIFLMPSRYEPCGLNQLYSLKYGTVPVVRETGGLADTVVNCAEDLSNLKSATGFSFQAYSGAALLTTIKHALQVYQDKKTWAQLMQNGMSQDWSWPRSAGEYHKLYLKLKS